MAVTDRPTPGQQLAEQVEMGLERPFNPVHLMDRVDWEVAIRSEMPWHLPGAIAEAAVILEQKYWCGRR